jgi:hypothetical protein
MKAEKMDQTVQRPAASRINWISVTTVLSAAILIAAEVFGAAYAGGWAIANLLGVGEFSYVLQILFFIIGLVVMAGFVRNARRIEPFVGKG